MRPQICLALYLSLLIIIPSSFGMSVVELREMLTGLKNQCMPQHGVGNDKVGQIDQGVFIEDHNVMCYIACVYDAFSVVKNNKLDRDLALKQIDALFPQDLQTATKEGIAKCIDIQHKYEDHCEGIFYSTKCLYENDPSSFLFP